MQGCQQSTKVPPAGTTMTSPFAAEETEAGRRKGQAKEKGVLSEHK